VQDIVVVTCVLVQRKLDRFYTIAIDSASATIPIGIVGRSQDIGLDITIVVVLEHLGLLFHGMFLAIRGSPRERSRMPGFCFGVNGTVLPYNCV
jgi:hypothetical protein